MKTANNPDKITVLNEFKPYLRFITAYNYENFTQNTWCHILSNVCYAFSVTTMNIVLSSVVILGVWYLIEINANFKSLAVALPLLISLLQMEITFIALIAKNQAVTETINRIQRVVDQRKSTTIFRILSLYLLDFSLFRRKIGNTRIFLQFYFEKFDFFSPILL